MTARKLSIADCNVRRIVIEASAPFSGAMNFEIGPGLQAIDRLHRFAPAPRTALVEYFQLENVIFDGQTGAVFKDGVHVSETRYSTQPSHTFNVDQHRVIRQSGNRPIFIGFHAWHHNYYHWLTQCIPSMFWALAACNQADTLFALPSLTPWQEHALALAGMSELERYPVDSRQQYAVAQLSYTTFTQGASTYRPSDKAAEVFRLIRSRVTRDSTPANSVIYVSREDAASRRMENEAEVTAALKAEGVDIVVPSRYSIEAQIATFSGAKAVIGPHGAGLTNIVFCEPGATLYEIMADNKPNPCYANLAQSMGMNYYGEAFPGHSTAGEREDWIADVQTVLQASRRLLELPPVGRA